MVTLFELLEEIWIRAEVQRSLVLLVFDINTGTIGDEEDGNGGTALLLCTAGHDGLREGMERGEGGGRRENKRRRDSGGEEKR